MLGIGKGRRLFTILLIDDDMVSREVTATVLTMNGYTVHTACSGDEALSQLDSQVFNPELILMDAQMPGLSGVELAEQLRARSLAPLYIVSGSEVPAKLLEKTDGFLLKPFGPESLLQILDKHAPVIHEQPPTDLPAVNPKTIADFRTMMSESAVHAIYDAVTADLERRYSILESAIARRDSKEIHIIGHSIKGGCGMAGAVEAARIGELLESGGDDLEYSQSLLPHFQTAIANLKRMLEAEFTPQGSKPVG